MTHETEPIQGVSEEAETAVTRDQPPPDWTFSVMLAHFLLAGTALLLAAAGLLWLRYGDLERVDLGLDMRITNPGTVYRQNTQIILAGAMFLAGACLLPFRAVNGLNRRQRSAMFFSRIVALMLLAGVPVAVGLWLYMDRLPETRGEMSTIQQVIDDVSLGVYVVIALLIAQSALALWYQVWLSSKRARRLLPVRSSVGGVLLQRIRMTGLALWAVLLVGIGIALGVVTDWLYEVPVARPDPGEFLYATTFDMFNEEWDIYRGRDRALIVDSDSMGFNTGRLADEALSIEYGSGESEGLVWSTLDRKFSDFDLRVTTQVVSDPNEESMYGVLFRYKDTDNFLLFSLSGDGYYALRKVSGGGIEDVSVWNFSEAIRQGNAGNEIRIVADHDSFWFFVNGQVMPLCLKGENLNSMWAGPDECVEGGELTYMYRDDTFSQGKIALFAGSIYGADVRVSFDDVFIIGPEPLLVAVVE